MAEIVTRFAPSPTGYLHVGGVRTALFSWLMARHHKGKYYLRIEDTDLARSTQAACDQLLEDLRWLGLLWDNPELVFQSKRLDIYNRIIEDLIAKGLAYRAYETPEELQAMRQQAERAKRSFIYRRRELSADELKRYEGRPHIVRFTMPVREWRFFDAVLDKEIVMPADEAQDFVIRKTDGMPTYHFAVVVDDQEMGISHVLRAQEHLKNTFYHIALQEALGYVRPIYGHIPIIQNLDGSKMGKRDRDKKIRHETNLYLKNTKKTSSDLAAACSFAVQTFDDWLGDSQKQLDIPDQAKLMKVIGLKDSDLPEILVHDFRKNGYLPEVLINFLALLGWSPGGDRERMSPSEMIELFSIEGIGKGNAKFSREKLISFNTDYCKEAPIERLVAAMKDYLSVNPESPLNRASDEHLAKLIRMKEGFRTLRQIDESSAFLLARDEEITYDPDAVAKVLKKGDGQGMAALRDLQTILTGVSDWKAAALEAAVNAYCAEKQLGLGKVAQPLRVAISGSTVSPPIFESLEFLGRDKTLARIARCLSV